MNSEEQALKFRRAYQLAVAIGDEDTANKIRTRVAGILPQWDKQRSAQEAASADFGPVMGPMLVGAGKKLTDWGGGAKKGFDWITGDKSGMAEQDLLRQQREAEFAPLRAESPIASSVGEMLPSMALPGGTAKGLATRAIQAGAVSGVDEFAASGGSVGDAAQAAAFGVAGNEAGRLASRLTMGGSVGPDAARANSPVHKDQVARADEIGWKLTPANRRDLPRLHQIEAGLARDPFTSGPFLDMEVANQAIANRTARKAIGLEGADKIDDYTLDLRHKELGAQFNELVGKGKGFVPLTDDFINKLDEVDAAYQRGLLRDPKLSSLIENFRNIANDQYISVDAYQQYASDLAKLARRSDDGGMQRALYELRDGLDYEFEKEFGRMPELREVRDQWKNLKDIERSKALSSGDFRPTVFYNYARNRSGRVAPGRDLNDISQMAHYFKNPVPNSGTPTGQAVQAMVDASPVSRMIRMAGRPLSDAYLGTGGRMEIPSALGVNIPHPLPEISEMVGGRVGREGAEPWFDGRF